MKRRIIVLRPYVSLYALQYASPATLDAANGERGCRESFSCSGRFLSPP